jgi:hypothetical protein
MPQDYPTPAFRRSLQIEKNTSGAKEQLTSRFGASIVWRFCLCEDNWPSVLGVLVLVFGRGVCVIFLARVKPQARARADV